MQNTLDRHILDPRHYYGFQRGMIETTHSDVCRSMHDVNWQLRYVELDNRALADSQLPCRVGRFRRIHTRAKHRVPNRHWMELMEFPRIATGLRDLRLSEGQNADVLVCVRGSPQVRVEWFKDWLPMSESESISVRGDWFLMHAVYIKICREILLTFRFDIIVRTSMSSPYATYSAKIRDSTRVW